MIKTKKAIFYSALILSNLYAANNNDADINLKKVEHSLSFQFIDISKTDVNRIICENGNIGKIVYSKDKEISMQKDGENVFVKLLPVSTKSNGVVVETFINDFTRDVYVECNEKMYSFNLVPKDVSAQTILLLNNGPRKSNGEARKFEKSNSFEKTITDIMKSVYKEKEPDGYTLEILKSKPIKFAELELLPSKLYVGDSYMVYEYKIVALSDIELDEKMFINFIANNPLSLSLTDLNLKKGDKARLFVITNANPDPITTEEKKQNFFQSLDELKQKNNEEEVLK